MLKYLKKDIDITNLSSFKTKAKTKYYFEINNQKDVLKLKEIQDFANNNSLKTLILGGGTNVLFAFYEFEGIIIKNNLSGYSYNSKTKILTTYTNEKIRDISKDLLDKYNQDLWYRFIGLPGTIGGAIYGNAGCFGLETQNNFIDTTVYSMTTGDIEIFTKKDVDFSYRSSIFKEKKDIYKYLLIEARFDLSKKQEKYSSDVSVEKFRFEIQPSGNSCGSFFKNPSQKLSAGYLIEQVGLKGYTYKTAFFSDKHANFLMTNCDNGDYKDLIYLIDLAKNKIKENFDINLINEVQIINN